MQLRRDKRPTYELSANTDDHMDSYRAPEKELLGEDISSHPEQLGSKHDLEKAAGNPVILESQLVEADRYGPDYLLGTGGSC